ncbi:TetR/AcrR family transcriptional regulator C-terminal domain-containing protein [Nonomuraea sediminis]|uniref:TetR/AcrR family transcriptional regulator C-terminal domain-containing protein n=1 Tax=Nonomuraea sediminis TaxID=2835864 RepID=UPI001BDD6263|nr:TetR/AcrR family transcriptional regulator C-terminal domain-containing protein [Nonomuraea sediminis]
MDADTIVRQALTLLRQDGLAGVTFRKLTTSLQVKAPAIYWRFNDKQELLEAMAEAILQEQLADLTPLQSGQPWQPWLAGVLHRLRRALLTYPDGARVVTGARPTGTPTIARIAEYGLRALQDGGLTLPEAANVVFTSIHYTFGHAIEEQDSTGAHTMDDKTAEEFVRTYPTIARAMVEARSTGVTGDDIFDAGISLIIGTRAPAGIEPDTDR